MDFGKDTLAKIFCREEEGGVDFYLKCIFVKSQEIKANNIYFTLWSVLAHSHRHSYQYHRIMFYIIFFVIGLPAVVCLLSGYL